MDEYGKKNTSLKTRHLLAPVLLLIGATCLPAGEEREETGLQKHFSRRGIEGCFVLLDKEAGVLHLANPKRATVRFPAASTFKIPNALIGLEVQAVSGIDEVIPYGGTREYFKTWEKDMNLREAMRTSNVAVFHQLAKRVGLERMQKFVRDFGYGNADIGKDAEKRFWLEGPLAISAREQVEFLDRLVSDQLPIKKKTKRALLEIVEYRKTERYVIYAKTGWAGPKEPRVGWWVGWIETGPSRCPFALNIAIKKNEDAKARIPIALECLKSLGKLPLE